MAAAIASTGEGSPDQLGNQVVSLLSHGRTERLAKLHHYPAAYSAKELDDDVAAVTKSLSFLLERFGRPLAARRAPAGRSFYNVGGGGGTTLYWESRSPYPIRQLTYEVKFERFGPGFLAVTLVPFGAGGAYEIKQIDFGVPDTRPEARQIALDVMRDMLAHMDITPPPDFWKLAAENIEPMTTPPDAPSE
jgi:hypothetical protein